MLIELINQRLSYVEKRCNSHYQLTGESIDIEDVLGASTLDNLEERIRTLKKEAELLTEKIATIEQRNYFKKGDIVEIFGPNHEIITYEFDKIYDEDNNIIDIVRHPRQIIKIKIDSRLEVYDMIRIKK